MRTWIRRRPFAGAALLLLVLLLPPALSTPRGREGMAAAAVKGLGGGSRALRVCLLTDVEGNWQYVRNVARQSECLRLEPRSGYAGAGDGYLADDLELRDDCLLVFGGDAGDKGGETLKCYEQLVRLKKKYPERVVLLVGNRDVNKMRLTSELDEREMDLDAMVREVHDGPLWVPEAKRVTIRAFLAQQLAASAAEATTCAAGEELGTDAARLQPVNTRANRLRWMLEHTMGAQGDFERRRSELEQRQSDPVGDDAVVASYEASVRADGGVIREFLRLGALAFVAHKTLFVHGGLMSGAGGAADPLVSFGRVPDAPDERYASVSDWVDRLNAWYRREVAAWIERPTWTRAEAGRATRGGDALLQYVLPGHPASVVMGRHLLPSGMPAPLPRAVVDALTAPPNGIERVVVGHTPHGNCPTVIHHESSAGRALQVVMCDTSYSDAAAADNRGQAAADVTLAPDGVLRVRGVLEDGRPIAFDSRDPLVGRRLADGTRVKARMADAERDEYLVYSVRDGFSYSYAYRRAAELALATEDS